MDQIRNEIHKALIDKRKARREANCNVKRRCDRSPELDTNLAKVQRMQSATVILTIFYGEENNHYRESKER